MSQKMQNAPVYFALAQVRFGAVLALDQYLPAIQESFRKNGYPDFERLMIATINMPMGGDGTPSAPMPTMQPQSRYVFSSEDRTASFMLDQSVMSYQTTAYDTYESFSREFMRGVGFVHQLASLNYSERIGIRYLDAICPLEGESLAKYLVPTVMGVYGALSPRTLEHSISETRTKLSNTVLIGRVIIMNTSESASVAFPPDLMPIKMTLAKKFNSVRGTYAIVDTDSWLEERESFDLNGLGRRLALLHDELRRSFDLTVTPEALEIWQ